MDTEQGRPAVVVVGCGYVGLTTAACLVELGRTVVGVDASSDRLDLLRQGRAPFFEADLDDLVASGLASGRLSFTDDLAGVAGGADVVFVCVPTPSADDGSADLSIVRSVVESLGRALPSGAVLVLKSTVPVGTSHDVSGWLDRPDVEVVANPEFLQAGRAVATFRNPDRVVVGADTAAAGDLVASLYDGMDAPIVRTDPRSAELIKYASNTYLAMRLSFVNTIATLCETGGGDAATVLEGMGRDRRIGPAFLQPGPGWGGSCFPKDTKALAAVARAAGADTTMLDATLAANEARFDQVAGTVATMVGGELEGCRVGVWGLTFKAGTDDLRDSPALAVVDRLVAAGARVVAHDPMVEVSPRDGVEVVDTPVEAATAASVLVVLTEWPVFAAVDPVAVVDVMAEPNMVDTRAVVAASDYRSVGVRVVRAGVSA